MRPAADERIAVAGVLLERLARDREAPSFAAVNPDANVLPGRRTMARVNRKARPSCGAVTARLLRRLQLMLRSLDQRRRTLFGSGTAAQTPTLTLT